ncbi:MULTISPECIES: hypothetical protein [unclassified Nocardioides]|uniref:hypothetical protein n=1 Tax=unclassified Nocardioides TaxID=2615069 RepID=UPI001F27A642|nr:MULTISPECIES: hypothetical protein [unclassified Nocardioides]
MLKILVLLQLAVLAPIDQHGDRSVAHRRAVVRLRRRDEHGSVTTEYVLWAVAVIAIVGIVVAAVTAYVQAQSGKIK